MMYIIKYECYNIDKSDFWCFLCGHRETTIPLRDIKQGLHLVYSRYPPLSAIRIEFCTPGTPQNVQFAQLSAPRDVFRRAFWKLPQYKVENKCREQLDANLLELAE